MFNFNVNMNMELVTLEVYLGTACVQRQQLQAPQIMLQAQFQQLCEQIANEQRPMSVKLIKQEKVFDFDGKEKILENYIEFKNLKMCDGDVTNDN